MGGAAAPWRVGLPVGLVAQAVQQVRLVQVFGEAVQHPAFLNAVLLAQAPAQHLHNDAVRDCRERRASGHSVTPAPLLTQQESEGAVTGCGPWVSKRPGLWVELVKSRFR